MQKIMIIGDHDFPRPDTISQIDRITFRTEEDDTSIPITSEAITQLLNIYDHIILQLPVDTQDQFIQGERTSLNQFITSLFLIVAKETNTNLHIQTNDDFTQISGISPLLLLEQNDSTFVSLSRKTYLASRHTVTSVQKWQTNVIHQADEVAYQYYSWLQPFTKKIIRIEQVRNGVHFKITGFPVPLLILQKVTPQLSPLMSEWNMKGGLLNKVSKKKKASEGRLWFIVSEQHQPPIVFSALTHFRPALPWPIYKLTQGLIHPFVMNQFSKQHMNKTD
ncbi:hypothetical protein ACM26V_06655 [Salipaludibacillus sp. HK11]|uniref:hypothetical protein n=1 Tax=Salipaludibacillus sp. HK11 TaxID=3394320 RepID=UPI0039FD619E